MYQDLSMVRGDTLQFGMEFTGLEGDLGAAFLTVRKTYNSTILVQKSLEDGISKVRDAQYWVRMAPEDTAELTPGVYKYDLEVSAGGDTWTVLIGNLSIKADVTR